MFSQTFSFSLRFYLFTYNLFTKISSQVNCSTTSPHFRRKHSNGAHTLTHSLTNSLTHSLTYSLTAHRISLTRLRLGCHTLRTQTGKYENRGALIPVEERTCLVCKENCIECEQHFLTYCRGFTTLRRELHSHISNADTHYHSLNDNEETRYLLRADHDYI